MRVIARAYRDQPLNRVVTGEAGKLVYLVNESAVDAIGIAPFSGVGFPRDAVFVFDSLLFESLSGAWDRGDVETLRELWKRAEPVQEGATA